MDTRPTQEITLPLSGAKVTLYEYLTNGQNRIIKKIAMSAIKIKVEKGKDPDIQQMDTSFKIDMEDQALRFLVKEIFHSGVIVADVAGFIDNLRAKDADFLYAKINELTDNSDLLEDSKKK